MAGRRSNLALRRKTLGFTQERLAAKLGVDRTTVQRWESGEREAQPWLRPRLAVALQQTLSPRRRARVLAYLAVIGIELRDRDRVLNYAHAALDEARATGSGMIGRKLDDLRRRLSPMRADAQIRELDDEIRTLTSTTRG
ncbi:helix-turn-helix transcriptional regulator [Actinophytocola oryzae]|uniref:DNA-binding XRE family transcriptional regulator n=1 Tax=Actinophytocola oryzae TaxID=502181 RepID=A0A4R7W486_9PSEU|nr:helix-turn-helix transcriptional regulator [Actinophytocola oryzae]TDV56437.1 DNA-binding XRE family transcriptional regulator [Actinophytocola oryzae]